MAAELTQKEYEKMIIGLIAIHFNEFKGKVVKMINEEIDEVKGTISNEHMFELGYNGQEPNYHAYNIECYVKYMEHLRALKAQVEHVDF